MIKSKPTIILTAIAFLLSCSIRKQYCDTTSFENLNLTPVNATLKIPAYIITDTIKYGDLSNIFERKVQSLDSSLVVFAGVKTFENDPYASFNMNHRMGFQKQQIESGQDSMRLIIEAFKVIDTIKIGYLKFLDEKRKRYESRIFFFRGRMFTNIWLFEKYVDEKYNKQSITDCILENIEFDE